MELKIPIKKRTMHVLVIMIILGIGAVLVYGSVNPSKAWHPVKQLSLSATDLTSVDENDDGVVDLVESALGVSGNSQFLSSVDCALVLGTCNTTCSNVLANETSCTVGNICPPDQAINSQSTFINYAEYTVEKELSQRVQKIDEVTISCQTIVACSPGSSNPCQGSQTSGSQTILVPYEVQAKYVAGLCCKP